jgi:hypothetical protein
VPFASGGGVDKAKSPPCEVTGEQRKGAVGLEERRSLDNQRERAEAEGGRRRRADDGAFVLGAAGGGADWLVS